MSAIAYDPAGVAKATGVNVSLVKEAIRFKQLRTRDVEGVPIVLASDLQAWIESFPDWDR